LSERDPAFGDIPIAPGRAGGPAFEAPWQARAFALTVLLHRRGAFDWSAALAHECATQGPGTAGYYEAWVRALDAMLAARGIRASARREDHDS
jgi:nitrile hydratase accessory protein